MIRIGRRIYNNKTGTFVDPTFPEFKNILVLTKCTKYGSLGPYVLKDESIYFPFETDNENIRFFEDKLYCFRDYKIYLIENNSKKLFFEQPESKHQYHNIIDMFIDKDILKIIVSDGIIYTYSFKKLISTFETNIEMSRGKFFLDGKCFCSDSDSLIIYIEKDSVWKIIFDEYSFDSCYISISNPVYEILFWDKLSLHLFDRNILKIIGEFICV